MKRVKYIGLEEGWASIEAKGIRPLTQMLEQGWRYADGFPADGGGETKGESKGDDVGGGIGDDGVCVSVEGEGGGGGGGAGGGAGAGAGAEVAVESDAIIICRVCECEAEASAVECPMCGSSLVVQRYQAVLKQAFAEIYGICYSMCSQREPYNWQEQLYQR